MPTSPLSARARADLTPDTLTAAARLLWPDAPDTELPDLAEEIHRGLLTSEQAAGRALAAAHRYAVLYGPLITLNEMTAPQAYRVAHVSCLAMLTVHVEASLTSDGAPLPFEQIASATVDVMAALIDNANRELRYDRAAHEQQEEGRAPGPFDVDVDVPTVDVLDLDEHGAPLDPELVAPSV